MGERTENVVNGDLGETISGLAAVIRDRRGSSPETSYTARLLSGKEDSLLKKLTEEATEVVMACKDDTRYLRVTRLLTSCTTCSSPSSAMASRPRSSPGSWTPAVTSLSVRFEEARQGGRPEGAVCYDVRQRNEKVVRT